MDVNMLYTARGQVLKAKMETGVSLDITRIAADAGRSNDLENLENLVDARQELTITGKYQRGTQSMIFAVLSNKGLQTGYDLTQIGVFANDPDDGEILYRIAQLERAFPISAEKDFPKFAIDCNFTDTISNASQVNVNVNPAGMASVSQLEVVQALAQEAFNSSQKIIENGEAGHRIIMSADEPDEHCQVHLKILKRFSNWFSPDYIGPSVSALLVTFEGEALSGMALLDGGTLKELTILPENSGL